MTGNIVGRKRGCLCLQGRQDCEQLNFLFSVLFLTLA
jgi:hypothetical protein